MAPKLKKDSSRKNNADGANESIRSEKKLNIHVEIPVLFISIRAHLGSTKAHLGSTKAHLGRARKWNLSKIQKNGTCEKFDGSRSFRSNVRISGRTFEFPEKRQNSKKRDIRKNSATPSKII